MAAHYDTYDYPLYWEGRDYEHCAEEIVLAEFLAKTGKVQSILDVGAGYGRLTPVYSNFGSKITITDPSDKLLQIARKHNKGRKFTITKGLLSDLPKLVGKKHDLVIMVRVMHHIPEIETALTALSELIKPGGYLILEFANKRHFKSLCSEMAKGNFSFSRDLSPKEVKSEKLKHTKTIPFFNYHPKVMVEAINNKGFTIHSIRSVSNFRALFLKKYIPKGVLLKLEKIVQKSLARFYFGPSIFVLAQKQK
jgi:ubiquinone/menaquinone biosynthesis C-methylase UbiE